jgi:protein gp37
MFTRMPTKIEWTDHTWNPWWGCDKIAPECDHCYAAVFASRALHGVHAGAAAKGEWTGRITRGSPRVWKAPTTWRHGARVFTCSMSDFWHERVPLDWLDAALDVIAATPHLTYQILTKRPGNIARKLADLKRHLPANVWIGATIGHPKSLPLLKPLRRVDASVRFLSVEPLLAPMVPGLDLAGIGWVIGGGESGRNARRCDPDWMRAVRDLCVAQGVPYFFKQWGAWANNPTPRGQELDPDAKGGATLDGQLWREFPRYRYPHEVPLTLAARHLYHRKNLFPLFDN